MSRFHRVHTTKKVNLESSEMEQEEESVMSYHRIIRIQLSGGYKMSVSFVK